MNEGIGNGKSTISLPHLSKNTPGSGGASLNNDYAMEVKPVVKLHYPTRAPFVRYMEKLIAPKSNVDKPLLEKRPEPSYLLENWPTSNAFTMIKHERIRELKRQANDRRQSELNRWRRAGHLATKIPKEFRQRFTAHAHLKDLIFEENLNEVRRHGMLFGPANLTLQPFDKHNVPLLFKKSEESVAVEATEGPVNTPEDVSAASKPTVSSLSVDSSRKDSVFNESSSKDDVRIGPSTTESRSTKPSDNSTETFDQINTFIDDRKKICMMELAIRTKEGEIDRLNQMLKAESEFLSREEKDLLLRHDEHDRYLKSICQRTAEAIHLAETEAHKRLVISERIKRTRYKLAHLNAECIKLEEEFIRLSTYKDFLDTVARTLQENKANISKTVSKMSASLNDPQATNKNHGEEGAITETAGVTEPVGGKTADDTETGTPVSWLKETNSEDVTDSLSVNAFFKSPQDLVDILAELESNNLTLIENVQEQEEACERVRVKAARLQKILNVERNTVDAHISREKEEIDNLQRDVAEIVVAKDAINEFNLLERYEKIFNLGGIDQFEMPWMREERNNRKGNSTDKEEPKPTVGEMLEILHDQIHKVYTKVFSSEGGARLDTLMMLKVLEVTIDDLSRTLSGYSRARVIKAKKIVDEHNRFLARQRQKQQEALAHEARLRRAVEKAREPPRWHRGRRIVERSCPPESHQTQKVEQEHAETEDVDADLFYL
ncbi:hypothetical protein AAHC03_021060 [Spirometra sp. Aus1]